MIVTIDALSHRGGRHVKLRIDAAKVCPHCGTSFNGVAVNATILFDGSMECDVVVATHYCAACDQPFVATYLYNECDDKAPFWRVWPPSRETVEFDPEIKRISPAFAEIYKQASIAESECLDHICGVAYRKALEFLVKDYAIFKHPDKADEIKAMQLAQAIRDHIDSKRIQALATKCAWIGNDETHYVMKHEDRSVEDLKKFLHAMTTFITADLALEDAESIAKR